MRPRLWERLLWWIDLNPWLAVLLAGVAAWVIAGAAWAWQVLQPS